MAETKKTTAKKKTTARKKATPRATPRTADVLTSAETTAAVKKESASKPSAEKRILRALELLGSSVQFKTEEEVAEFSALVSGKPVPKPEPDDEGLAPAPAVVTSSTEQ